MTSLRIAAASWLALTSFVHADAPAEGGPPAPFAVVLIDAKSEAALGPFPYDRGAYAKGIEALARANARGVVLKFFIDAPKSEKGDAALAGAMARTKVILQARLDDAEPNPNPLPDRFVMKNVTDAKDPKVAAPFAGKSGWLPIATVAERAHDLGFIDSTHSVELVPVVERYQGRFVKSLYTAALELASNKPASVVVGKAITLGARAIPTDASCLARITLPRADDLKAHSFIDLIDGKLDPAEFRDKVVILGYDGAKMPETQTPIGKVRGHRLFCYQLFSLWREVAEAR